MGPVRAMSASVLIVGALVLSACSGQTATPSEPVQETPAAPSDTNGAAASEGEELAKTKCTMCHTYDRIEQASKSSAEWESTIDRMVDHGLVVSDEERAAITEYLANE